MSEEETKKKTELELVAGLFRNTDKNGNIYYTGKNEGATKPYFRVMKRVEKKAATSVED